MINNNINKFNVPNINVIHGQLPQVLKKMQNPDRIFIGGGGKDLVEIVEQAIQKLKKNGRIVVNTILLQNLDSIFSVMKKMGLKTGALSVNISKSKTMPHGSRFEASNPVWIIYGKKEF